MKKKIKRAEKNWNEQQKGTVKEPKNLRNQILEDVKGMYKKYKK